MVVKYTSERMAGISEYPSFINGSLSYILDRVSSRRSRGVQRAELVTLIFSGTMSKQVLLNVTHCIANEAGRKVVSEGWLQYDDENQILLRLHGNAIKFYKSAKERKNCTVKINPMDVRRRLRSGAQINFSYGVDEEDDEDDNTAPPYPSHSSISVALTYSAGVAPVVVASKRVGMGARREPCQKRDPDNRSSGKKVDRKFKWGKCSKY
ncbi:hypothetical protein ANCDUO_02093 [Ancylostoma duodenale]|uniref:Uncharacterized protein n=1 Tax=Ancylostoma duodenale TaxID=51022 RepID=A0A0C2H1E9_9BILA|nr:hypothetical protein ANCDUO_02093 [Ancylostoma duodenale]